jgi:DNA-binding CsgD family transcriptional regulator
MNKELLTILDKNDLLSLMDIAQDSLFCYDLNGLKELFHQLEKTMAFSSVCCAYGDIRKAVRQAIPDVNLLDISYPENYLNHYLGNRYHLTDPVIAGYLETLQPVNWDRPVVVDEKTIRYTDLIDAESLGIRGGWTYGTVPPGSNESSMFFIATEQSKSGERERVIIKYIIPFLSEAYIRIIKNTGNYLSRDNIKITQSEVEILNWLKEGKTSWEISIILCKSERVINFHINNIVKKLNSMNRTHAVVIALKKNIISL